MNKPYIVCHMMASVDGRIDCAMTEQLPGVQEYYATLDALEAPTRVSGRVTAELEMARPGAFQSEHHTPLGRTAFSKAAEAEGYEVVVDTHGTLLWDSVPEGERPLLILTSEQVSREYLAYLDRSRISWIACGAERIDLPRACDILAQDFGVKRMAVVGGGHVNAGFLAAGLLDEVSVDAARYFFNSRSSTSPVDFDLDLAVREDSENPVYYVQYAHARICTLIHRLAEEGHAVPKAADTHAELMTTEEETTLIRTLARLPEEIHAAARDYDPSRINRYLTELAGDFHRFYGACRIKGEEPAILAARLKLADSVRSVLANGLGLLGVTAPEKM